MKVIIIVPHNIFVHPWTKRIRLIAQGLQTNGCEVVIFYFSYRGKKLYSSFNNIKIIELKPKFINFFYNIKLIRKELINTNILYLCKQLKENVLTGLFSSFFKKIKIHIDYEDFESCIAAETFPTSNLCSEYRIYEKVLFRICDYVSYSTHYIKSEILNNSKKKMFYLPAVLDVNDINIKIVKPDNKLNIIYFGQGFSVASHNRFIKNAVFLSKKYKNINFILVLSLEKNKNKIKNKIKQITNLKVYFDLEFVKLKELLIKSHIAYLPFDNTPAFKGKSPLKVLESILYKLVVVSNNIGEIPYFINDTEFLCNPDLKGELDLLEKVINNYEYYYNKMLEIRESVVSEFNNINKTKQLIEYWNNTYFN